MLDHPKLSRDDNSTFGAVLLVLNPPTSSDHAYGVDESMNQHVDRSVKREWRFSLYFATCIV